MTTGGNVSDLGSQQDYYDQIGFSTRIGFGDRPAILVIDMCRGITEAGNPLSIDMDRSFAPMNAMLRAARDKSWPVVYTTVAYTPPHFADGGTFVKKIPLLYELAEGSPHTEIDPRCAPQRGDVVMVKKFPSGFYGTHMQSLLTQLGIDTTIVVGNSTSGCVRATVIDAVSGGFRVIIPRECVADRAPLSHAVNLFDMDAKYGDVVPASEVLEYLERVAHGPMRSSVGVAGV
jgi:maleamate amidohydrolase